MHRVLVDWDSTINDFDGALVQSINKKFGSNHSVADHTHWDHIRFGMPREHVDYLWRVLFRDREWNENIPPKPGAMMAFNDLIADGHEVHVVTSRFKYMRPWVASWLSLHGFRQPYAVATLPKKGVYATRNRITVAMEDATHNARDLANAGVSVYLIDSPWNQGIDLDFWKIKRVPSFAAAAEDLMGGARV